MKTKLRRESNERPKSFEEVEKILGLYDASVQNARELLDDAEILRENGRYPRATFLAITAFEELGKAHMIADYAFDFISEREFRKAFSDHRIKTAYLTRSVSIGVTFVIAGMPGSMFASEDTIMYEPKQAAHQVETRVRALYVSCDRDYKPVTPSSITKDECDSVFEHVYEKFEEAEYAEWINGRVSSKALFK